MLSPFRPQFLNTTKRLTEKVKVVRIAEQSTPVGEGGQGTISIGFNIIKGAVSNLV